MAGARGLLRLWLGCFCLSLAQGERPKQQQQQHQQHQQREQHVPERHGAAPGGRARGGGPSPEELRPRDGASEHMLRLYDRYSGAQVARSLGPTRARAPREGNTVRSFRGKATGTPESQGLLVFNLTSLSKSESILSATLHLPFGELATAGPSCPASPGCPHQIGISAWTLTPGRNQSRLLGHLSIDPARPPGDAAAWLSKDVTQLLRKARDNGQLLLGLNVTAEGHPPPKRTSLPLEPYILVYANDAAMSEPDSVASSFWARRDVVTGASAQLDSHIGATLSLEQRRRRRRRKRSAAALLPLQNNELPGAEYHQYTRDQVWGQREPYKALQTQPPEKGRSRKKQRKGSPQKSSQTLQFDEHTLKKARRKQWTEPRNCARRYLKVDFADIGWSEWIISPKSFDAYYCSGACQFPMPKSLRPSNHATIQSIVRAVGVIPRIPEPCCVPEKMSSLSILFFDENKNVVLKVYPNMTVESCACR
ncbi:bone morphogenetic protein 3 [Microcebus murinus]|uniref:bone morphogenetic protein 3 n=1 Tax=Microcebus murinus TaxID=30608 RepID=UPI003F6B73F9